MSKSHTLLYYTNNLTPRGLLKKTLLGVLGVAAQRNDLNVLVCSQFANSEYPQYISLEEPEPEWEQIDRFLVKDIFFNEHSQNFPIQTYVIGKLPRLLTSLVRQLVFCLERVETETVIFVEDDILYPSDYFDKVIEELNNGAPIVYAEPFTMFNMWGFYNPDGELYLSRYSGRTDLFLKHFRQEQICFKHFEPLLRGKISGPGYDGEDMYADYALVELDNPVLDIRHGLNMIGVPLHPDMRTEDPYWGKMEDILKLINDPSLMEYLEENRKMLTGLDVMTRTNGKPTAVDLAHVFRHFARDWIYHGKSDLR